ncbi:helix-turn-helix domain-containing protein [Sporosarcina oncorhynchi]|uniref:Helix-turn-helix domain-containing protein n=1 Tax=Sporosarcina oncorhynchi TaxID=3056444 RepID=A0ABZ0L531_9BACL|nr:helix-turn-helix domain-containing protein [Sporosarcina sp. T2O-4]WOV87682.1 helix-turn-helix domain-containing protein [Sporosarcina sp. T2O-4]
MNYGYIRPTVKDQSGTAQLQGLILDKIFTESHGLAKKRTELEQLFMNAQINDELYFQNIEVLADSMQQLLDALRLAERDKIVIHFIDEQLTNQSIMNFTLQQSVTFFMTIQSTLFSHSSTFTLQEAKEQGKSIGRPRKSDENLQRAFTMYDSKKYSLFEIKEATGISKSTLYRYLDERSPGN